MHIFSVPVTYAPVSYTHLKNLAGTRVPVARIRHVPERQPRQQQRYADVWIVRKEKVHMTSLRMPPGVWYHRPYPPGGNAFRPMGNDSTTPLYPKYIAKYIGTAVTGTNRRNSPISQKLWGEKVERGKPRGRAPVSYTHLVPRNFIC